MASTRTAELGHGRQYGLAALSFAQPLHHLLGEEVVLLGVELGEAHDRILRTHKVAHETGSRLVSTARVRAGFSRVL
jgi:hypothetical protein